MTSVTEQAEHLGKARAVACLLIAAVILALLLVSFGPTGVDYLKGMWLGVTACATLYIVPICRWIKPGSAVARLLDDESTRENRRLASTAGLVAGVFSALTMSFVTADGPVVSSFDTARVIATAAMVAALVSFATLELRAVRD